MSNKEIKQDVVLSWLNETDIPISTISKKSGISRKTLYNWKNGSNIRKKSINKIFTIYKNEIKINNQLKITEGGLKVGNIYERDNNFSMDAEYVLKLQQEKIERQEKEIYLLKRTLDNPVQKRRFDEIDADMETDVQIKNIFSMKPMERVISRAEGHEAVADKLGLHPDDYYNNYLCVGKWSQHEKHPVDRIIEKKSLAEIRKMTLNLPAILESMKFIVGSHYMAFPVVYSHNDNICATLCYVLLEWGEKPVKVRSKTVIVTA
jgi:hypothetical protein